MKKIRGHDLFFDFDLLSLMRLLGMKKIFLLAENSAIFNRMIALNIRKDRNSLAIKGVEKKYHLFTFFRFDFCLIMEKSKLLNPRCARYAWGQLI
jgi:hypothetical protein